MCHLWTFDRERTQSEVTLDTVLLIVHIDDLHSQAINQNNVDMSAAVV